MKLQDYKNKYDKLSTGKSISGKEALEAVKQNGFALQYVKEQTEEICLEAVKQDGYALKFVESHFFKDDATILIDGKEFSESTIKAALREYIS